MKYWDYDDDDDDNDDDEFVGHGNSAYYYANEYPAFR